MQRDDCVHYDNSVGLSTVLCKTQALVQKKLSLAISVSSAIIDSDVIKVEAMVPMWADIRYCVLCIVQKGDTIH